MVATTAALLSPDRTSSGHLSQSNQPSTSFQNELTPSNVPQTPIEPPKTTPKMPPSLLKNPSTLNDPDESAWGSNFWVTLVDPQTQTSFFACPATGQVSWDPPVGNFVLPPSDDGEWWELSDESRGGLAYYYQTKTGETVWERPQGFVIPLGIIQNTALGRRLSQTRFGGTKSTTETRNSTVVIVTPDRSSFRRSRSYNDRDLRTSATSPKNDPNQSPSASYNTPRKVEPSQANKKQNTAVRRSTSEIAQAQNGPHRFNGHTLGQHLPPIPGSPDITNTDPSNPPSPSSPHSPTSIPANSYPTQNQKESPGSSGKASTKSDGSANTDSISRARAKSSPNVQHRSPPQQSLGAAVELFTGPENPSISDSGHSSVRAQSMNGTDDNSHQGHHARRGGDYLHPSPRSREKNKREPPYPQRAIPPTPAGHFWRSTSSPAIAGREISGPVLNHQATLTMSPVKNRVNGKPIPVQSHRRLQNDAHTTILSNGTYPILPQDLAMDIQQFSESEFAKRYFSTHRTGFIFRRKVPVAQLMTWQRTPLTSPLLTLHRSLNKDAVKIFKVIQRIMGDRERDRSGLRVHADNHLQTVASINTGSTTSLAGSLVGVLEEERWLLGEGVTHGELRDEIYCQLIKQLSGNPNPESVFKGMQLFCVLLITFPPSKNFETYLQSYLQQKTMQQEGRVDVMAKYCLRRLAVITKKGPRGKSPTIAEIETASDAAFNPSTFGESLDAIIRLQERNYPQQMVPIILPFLADGILALGGTRSEGIFRVPGDGDSVSELKLRIDRGYYTLDGVDDPYVLASLLKLWLRELCDPLVPEEMYNECIASSGEPEACVRIVERLPTINRRVVLFVISFLQLFLEERIMSVTKMTPVNLALVMAPNLLRCTSESMAVVFTNAQYEQIFVYHLLLHLKCNRVDSMYLPTHGLGAISEASPPRTSKSRSRRPNH